MSSDRYAPPRADLAAVGVTRVMAITLEIAAVILFLLNAAAVVPESHRVPAWWEAAAVLAAVGPAVLVLLGSRRLSPRALRVLCGIHSIAVLAVLALAVVVLPRGATTMPWIVQLLVIAGAGAAVAWGSRPAIAVNIAIQVIAFTAVAVLVAEPHRANEFAGAVFRVFYVTLFAGLALTLGRAGRLLDSAALSAISEARASATAEATRNARRRVASLIHDSVIVALLAHANAVTDESTSRAEARHALAAIDQLDRIDERRELSPVRFAWLLQSITTDHDPVAEFRYEVDGENPVPPEVADAVVESASEALRNSIRHAPPGRIVARQVAVDVRPERIRVLVLDDGAGFDPASVSPDRLGLREGVVGRMAAIRGGDARIRSRQGFGTVIELGWERVR